MSREGTKREYVRDGGGHRGPMRLRGSAMSAGDRLNIEPCQGTITEELSELEVEHDSEEQSNLVVESDGETVQFVLGGMRR